MNTRTESYVAASGRRLVPGTEVSITGERGRFRFVAHVVSETGAEWIDVIGGANGVRMWRSFHPDRIKTVHTKSVTMTPAEARALVNTKNRVKRTGRIARRMSA